MGGVSIFVGFLIGFYRVFRFVNRFLGFSLCFDPHQNITMEESKDLTA